MLEKLSQELEAHDGVTPHHFGRARTVAPRV